MSLLGTVDHHDETKLWGKRTATHKMRVAEAVETLQNCRRKTPDHGDSTGPTASSREDLIMETSSSPSAPPCRVVSSRTASRYEIKPPNEEGEGVTCVISDGVTLSAGVATATVSLMLSSSHQSRPPSRHKPRPLHTCYYSKYKRGMF